MPMSELLTAWKLMGLESDIGLRRLEGDVVVTDVFVAGFFFIGGGKHLGNPAADLCLGESPLFAVQAGYDLKLEFLVMIPGQLIVAQGVGEKGQGELGGTGTAVAPFGTGRG